MRSLAYQQAGSTATKLSDDLVVYLCIQFLEVVDIVMLEGASRKFKQTIESSRYLWLTLLHDLDIDHAPDLPKYVKLDKMNTQDIRKVVVRAVRGFLRWNDPGGPIYDRQVIIKKDVLAADHEQDDGIGKIKLVPGGEYFIAQRRRGAFELWSIEKQSLVVSYEPQDGDSRPTTSGFDFEVDISEDGKQAIIAAKSHTYSKCNSSNYVSISVSVALIELSTGQLTEVYREPFQFGYMAHAVDMEGDFIAAVLDNGSQIAIVNWKTKAKVYIKMDGAPLGYRLRVLRDHLIFVSEEFHGGPNSYQISAINLPTTMRFKEGEGEPNVSPCIPISELVDDTNRIQLDRLEYSPDRRITYHYTAQIMSGFSLTYTHWKRKNDRNIYLRLLMTDGPKAKVVTVKINTQKTDAQSPKPDVALTNDIDDFPCVITNASGRVLANYGTESRSFSSSGRALLLHVDKETSHWRYANFVPFRWSSLWALSKQENYDAIANGKSRDQEHDKKLLLPWEMDPKIGAHHMRMDELSGAVFACPTFYGGEDLSIWYIS